MSAQRRPFTRRRKSCPFSGANAPTIDYKDVRLLQRFVSERGKIVPSRISAVSSKKQRELAQALKRARFLERLPKLGQMGDVVKVKPGYARNFLLPQKKALRATKDNITYFESQRKTLEAQNLERRQEAEAVGAKMSDLKVTLIRQASEALQLYGSVSSRDIADAAAV